MLIMQKVDQSWWWARPHVRATSWLTEWLSLQVSGSGESRATWATGQPNRTEAGRETEEEEEGGNTQWSLRAVSAAPAAPARAVRDLLREPEWCWAERPVLVLSQVPAPGWQGNSSSSSVARPERSVRVFTFPQTGNLEVRDEVLDSYAIKIQLNQGTLCTN